jgi:hypothetical protein
VEGVCILNELRISSIGENVIYFDGWDGLGASGVLRAMEHPIATASEAPAELQIWEDHQHRRRALHRAVAKQLELPAVVMEMFDRHEEDDFHGG